MFASKNDLEPRGSLSAVAQRESVKRRISVPDVKMSICHRSTNIKHTNAPLMMLGRLLPARFDGKKGAVLAAVRSSVHPLGHRALFLLLIFPHSSSLANSRPPRRISFDRHPQIMGKIRVAYFAIASFFALASVVLLIVAIALPNWQQLVYECVPYSSTPSYCVEGRYLRKPFLTRSPLFFVFAIATPTDL